MTPQEIVEALAHDDDPWVSDPEEGVYCFYCGCRCCDSFQGPQYKHEKDCLWLEIERYKKLA